MAEPLIASNQAIVCLPLDINPVVVKLHSDLISFTLDFFKKQTMDGVSNKMS